jgi:hypothetical protein
MNSEQNVPDVQMHQGPPPPQAHTGGQMVSDQMNSKDAGSNVQHGQGQSKSSRRRRRKRKNKGPETAGEQQGGDQDSGFNGDVQAAAQANGSAQPAQPRGNFQPSSGQQQAGTGTGTKRWKKKFRDRDRQRTPENPGNVGSVSASSNGGGGGYRDANSHQPGNGGASFKRKGGGGKQQRGPRSFVGPMDHSYRVVNGNFADTPPSTIDTGRVQPNGRGYHSDSQPIDYSIGRPIPIAEDAPTKIVFFIEDLFFNAKITETARKLGVKVAFIKNDKEAIAELVGQEEADRPGLIVFDLNNANAKPLTLIPKLKAKLKRSTSIVGFLSHLQGDLKAKAVEAGCDTVMPRAAFSQNLPNLLRRYGLQEKEEEGNFNQ